MEVIYMDNNDYNALIEEYIEIKKGNDIDIDKLEELKEIIVEENSFTNPLDVDWITILLALFALIAIGGLIPFYLWVYFVYNPPIR